MEINLSEEVRKVACVKFNRRKKADRITFVSQRRVGTRLAQHRGNSDARMVDRRARWSPIAHAPTHLVSYPQRLSTSHRDRTNGTNRTN